MRLIIFILALVFIAENHTPSSDIIKTRDLIAEINISFLEKRYPNEALVSELNEVLNELIGVDSKIERLIDSFNEFENILESKLEVDTLKKIFRAVNNEFNSIYGEYLYNEIISPTGKKIIVLSTSMSCECTLELCYKNESEVEKLHKENPGLFDYAVVDCYTNSDLQTKYEVGFIPVVVILDSSNQEVKRFVREENIFIQLKNYLMKK